MFKNKYLFFFLVLTTLSGTIAAQTRLTDDRELFMGVPTASAVIRPNVMIMTDVSGSMSQSIYHPAFDRKLFYNRTNPNSESSAALPAMNLDAKAKVISTETVTGHSTWRRWNLTSNYYAWNVDQIIDYIGTDNLPHKTKIKQKVSQTNIYIDMQYETTYVAPMTTEFIYVNETTTNLLSYFVKSDGTYPLSYMPCDYSTGVACTLPLPLEFRICRPNYTITVNDARGMVSSTGNVSGHSTWRRWNLSSSSNNFVVNQIIDYTGVDNLPHKTKIKEVNSQTRLYIDKGYESTYIEPKLNIYFYVNLRTIPNPNSTVSLINKGATCGDNYTGYDVKLYTEPNKNPAILTGNRLNDFDINYLYWLFYWATPTQIADVTTWSDTFQFPDSQGVLVAAGKNRISVARDVMKQIVADNYDKFNLGIATLSTNSSGASIRKKITQQNSGTGNTLAAFNTAIDGISHGGGTPLAIALADIWAYFKGTFGAGTTASALSNYNYNNGDQTLDTDAPIEYWCQSNYLILVTDGESNTDRLASTYSRFSGTLLSYNPDHVVNGNGGWGVLDNHDYNPNDSTNGNWYNNTVLGYCPGNSCWNLGAGSDYLDDIAFLMYDKDLFPDTVYDGIQNPLDMPNKQIVETFAIGFSINNNLLYNTAENGNTSKASGAYKTANNFNELLEAIQNFVINITLRDFGFSSFTAPKKVSSTQGEGASFVGYFKPKTDSAIWEGHLQSFKLTSKWCPDFDNSGKPNDSECNTSYNTQLECESASSTLGATCVRSIYLASTPDWDTAAVATNSRALFTHNSGNTSNPYGLINFTDSGNLTTLRGLFGLTADAAGTANAQLVVNKIKAIVTIKINNVDTPVIQLADIFHSDIAYVGAPIPGKKYLKNLNPKECGTDPDTPKNEDANCFEKLAADQANRQKVLYVGTNDGIIHQINATTGETNSGKELWGFIPDEVLPTLPTIALNNEFAFTTDGRLQADDIYYRGTSNTWKTLLAFGLRDGGNSFYALDITTAASQPVIFWKFQDPDYSGKSWGKPNFGKIKYWNGSSTIDLWVIIVAGGFAFNNENPTDLQGKGVFVIDASSGQLLWMIGYKPTGVANPGIDNDEDTPEIDTIIDSSVTNGLRYLTAAPEFNYCIPAALTVIDRDGNGYLDTMYFGNVAGHMFKTDLSASDPNNWQSYLLFKKDTSSTIASAVVSAVGGSTVTLTNVTGTFAENQNVIALDGASSSHAMGIVNGVNSSTSLTIAYTPSGGSSFQVNDTIVVPTYDPIFLSPAVFFDPCFNLWVAFGTGDRLRSRTNATSGKFAAFRDGTTLVSNVQTQKTNLDESDLVALTWSGDTLASTNVNIADKWGWYFTFPEYANHEKMFDPEPLILPDMKLIPHIYFNTYQPSAMITGEDCNAPEEGNMNFYNLKMDFCPNGTVAGTRESGRIAGGGMFEGGDFILYEGTGNVASIPPLQDIKPIKLLYTGGLLFWKEKKR